MVEAAPPVSRVKAKPTKASTTASKIADTGRRVTLFEKLMQLVQPKARKAAKAKAALTDNMNKAFRMKKEAGPQTQVPDHRTAHEGGVKGSQFPTNTDRDAGSQGSHQPQLKRSQVARSGDS